MMNASMTIRGLPAFSGIPACGAAVRSDGLALHSLKPKEKR